MEQSTTNTSAFTPCASLAALGLYLRHIDFLAPIRTQVTIMQKTLVHTPFNKLTDAFITILAGAHGLVEVNTRLRSDTALQEAFGRTACADQSTIQATLNACTDATVSQLTTALTAIYRRHSQGYRHPYAQRYQLLDVDLSGLPCGPKAALATKGYFAKQRNRRGHQLGRVVATRYGEIVTDQLFAGTVGLTKAFIPLVEAAEQVLGLDATKRQRTLLRIDSGGGSIADVNWALARGYQIHTKDYSRQRARNLGQSVTDWIDDPQIPGRQVGWVTTPAPEYVRPVSRVAVRWKQKSGQWEYAVIISTLLAQAVLAETSQPAARIFDAHAVLLAYVQCYDARGGGVETSFRDDKQGLGMTKRNKKRFAAQQMVMLLGSLAHNTIVWARGWLSEQEPKLRRYGLKRLVRDIFHMSGFLVHNARGCIVAVVLNQRALLVRGLTRGLDVLLRPQRITVNWGQI
jgi:Transposase DDE domain group 1